MLRRDPLAPVHPGEVLREEFLLPLGISAPAAARAMQVPRTRIERLAREETAVTADTALRLEKAFGSSAEFWMNLQRDYDLRMARRAGVSHAEAIQPLIAAE